MWCKVTIPHTSMPTNASVSTKLTAWLVTSAATIETAYITQCAYTKINDSVTIVGVAPQFHSNTLAQTTNKIPRAILTPLEVFDVIVAIVATSSNPRIHQSKIVIFSIIVLVLVVSLYLQGDLVPFWQEFPTSFQPFVAIVPNASGKMFCVPLLQYYPMKKFRFIHPFCNQH